MKSNIRFGTDGWRSKVDSDFSVVNVRRVAKAIENYLHRSKNPGKGVFIGYDGRIGSKGYASACAEVLASGGIASFLPPRPVPTPVAAFAAVRFSLSGAIMITASHNPPTYNGIKFIPHYGGPATADITGEIEKLIPKAPPVSASYGALTASGMIAQLDPIDEYFAKLEGVIAEHKLPINVTVDPMHGATAGIIELALQRFGVSVKTVRGTIDPIFGGSVPDPIPSNMQLLKSAVIKNGSDLGFALDGDGDRIAAVTDKGEFLMANQILPLLYLHMLDDRSFHGDAARTVATSHFIDSIAKKRAMRIIEVPVGFKYISPLLREKKIIIGGEESGGISFVTHIPEKDGIASALMLIESISMSGTSLSETMAKAQDEYGSFRSLRQDIKVDYLSPTILDDMKNRIGLQVLGESVSSINKLDGMKITLSDASWLLFRLSGTENMLRIYAESDSISKTEKMLAYGRSLIR